MRFILALAAAWVAAISSAAFDLQFVSRYSSSAIANTTFRFVEPTSDGYLVGGSLGEDVLLAKFDLYGSLISSQIWDSPTVGLDTLTSMVVAADGSVYVVAERQNVAVYALKFSSSLVLLWERETIPGESYKALADTCALDGRTYLQIHFRDTNRLRNLGWHADGSPMIASSQNGIPANYWANKLEAFEVSSGGFVVAGRKNDHEFFTRRNGLLDILYDTTLGGTANSSNQVTDVSALPDFTVVGVGRGYNGSSQAAIYSVSSSGVVARTLRSEGFQLESIQKIGANLYQAELFVQSGVDTDTHLVRFNSTNRVFTKTVVNDAGISAHLAPEGSGDALFFRDDLASAELQVWDMGPVTERFSRNLGDIGVRDVTETTRSVVGVGYVTRPDVTAGMIVDYDEEVVDQAELTFSGAGKRIPMGRSVVGADGSITTASLDASSNLERTLVTRYRSDGTLAFARSVLFGGSLRFVPSAVAVGPSGEAVVIGDVGDFGSIGWAKLSSSGVVEFTKTLTPFPGAYGIQIAIGADGSVYLSGAGFKGPDARSWLAKYTSSGLLVYVTDHVIVPSTTGIFIVQDLALSGNRAYICSQASNSSGTVVKLRQLNATTGATQDNIDVPITSQFRMTLAVDGNVLVMGETAASAELFKYLGTSVSTIMDSKSWPGASANHELGRSLATSANGNTVVTLQDGGMKLVLLDANLDEITRATIEPTVDRLKDIVCDPSNNIYILGEEDGANSTVATYAAKYLSTGIRSAQRRTAGRAQNLSLLPASGGVWISGQVGTRKKGWGPYAAKYSN